MKEACGQYIERVKLFLANADIWKTEGEVVSVNGTYSYSVPVIGVLTGLLLPAIQSARQAAQRMSSSNNTRQLVIAMLNYEFANRQLVKRAIKSKDGKPLLSWRVAVLPTLKKRLCTKSFILTNHGIARTTSNS